MTKTKVIALICVLSLFGFLIFQFTKPAKFVCQDKIGCISLTPEKPVKIGVMQALTGGPALIGNAQLNTIKLVFKKHNNQLLGHPVELKVEDEKCSSAGGTTAALKFVADLDIVAVIGPTCSGAAVSASKILSEAGYVILSGTASSPYLTSIGSEKGKDWQPGFFRTISNAATLGQAAAIYAFNELGVRKAATVDDGDAYTKGNTDFFIKTFNKLGGEIVFEGTVNKGETNMLPVLTAIANARADFLFSPIFMPEGMHLVKMKDKAGLAKTPLMGMGALLNDEFIRFTGEKGVGTYLVLPSPPGNSPQHDQLVQDYIDLYGHPPKANMYGYVYDAAELLYQVLKSVAVQEKDGTLHFERQKLRDALYATKGFKGITGPISSNQFGDMAAPSITIIRLDDPNLGMQGFKSNIVYRLSPKDFK